MAEMVLTIKDVMVSPVFIIHADETAQHAASYMSQKEIGCLVVMADHKVVGMVTERDLINRVIVDNKDPKDTLVKDIMTEPPVVAKPDTRVEDAVMVMFKNKIKKLIVVEDYGDERRLVGIVTLTDIARVNPALMSLLKSLFIQMEEAPPKRIEKAMNYYIV
jgi:CBS domain-containing protein